MDTRRNMISLDSLERFEMTGGITVVVVENPLPPGEVEHLLGPVLVDGVQRQVISAEPRVGNPPDEARQLIGLLLAAPLA